MKVKKHRTNRRSRAPVKNVIMNIALAPELREKLEQASDVLNVSMSEIVRQAIEGYLNQLYPQGE